MSHAQRKQNQKKTAPELAQACCDDWFSGRKLTDEASLPHL